MGCCGSGRAFPLQITIASFLVHLLPRLLDFAVHCSLSLDTTNFIFLVAATRVSVSGIASAIMMWLKI
jgi:hypothetical protein